MALDVAAHNRRIRERAIEQEAEARGARLDRPRRVFVVPSRSRPGICYDLTLRGVGGRLVAACSCQAAGGTWPLGALPCWHSAAGALAMERVALVAWSEEEGGWTVLGPSTPGPPVPEGMTTKDEHRRTSRWNPPRYGTPEYARMVSALVD